MMKIPRFKHPITVALVLLCLGLTLVLVIEVWFVPLSPEISVPLASTPKTRASAKENFSLPPLDHYQEIVERSLFSRTRRPIAPQGGASSPPAAKKTQLDSYSLTAVIITPNKRFALLRSASDKRIHRFEEGQEIQGWTLKAIKSESAIFSKDNEHQELQLLRRTPAQLKLAKPPLPSSSANPKGQAQQSQNIAPSSQDQNPEGPKGFSTPPSPSFP